ncbi:four helix bundle protein [Fluviicola sp.]|uniref:four helix bundle protein n=1 Tax=Fluviicola sp. TaxID=1917219 RepID=UPI0031E1A9E5
MSENTIQTKSFEFAVQIIKTYKLLISEKKEFILSKQLLRSGTSIGANISEAVRGQSTKDFIHKLQISRKEANETLYWIKLLEVTDYLSAERTQKLIILCEELLKILTAIIKSTENKMKTAKQNIRN